MNPIEFQRKWLANTQKERTASQSHFNDLCELVGHPKPLDLDPEGAFFTFEKGASKLCDTQGITPTGETPSSGIRAWLRRLLRG